MSGNGRTPSPHETEENIKRELDEHNASKDRKLIRYLMRHRHTTPFEMVELKFLVRVPMDCWRQWIRHRTASVNEYSTRYTEAIDSQQKTEPHQWRLQSKSNKQGSEDWYLEVDNPNKVDEAFTGRELSMFEADFHEKARKVYLDRLESGVAKEQARKDLPLSTYTEAYWKIDLHNLLHFLSLRMDAHAQKEIRDYARTIGYQIVKPLFPTVWRAFKDYRVDGMFLSALDREILNFIYRRRADGQPVHGHLKEKLSSTFDNDRERNECVAKMKELGIL